MSHLESMLESPHNMYIPFASYNYIKYFIAPEIMYVIYIYKEPQENIIM
jgi:hypothetical protein